MNDTIAELQEQLDGYTDGVLMEIIEDAEFDYLCDLRGVAEDAVRIARDLAEELDGVEER